MSLTSLKGKIRFRVAAQQALPKWQQTALRDALAKADAPPESLRFQCRIATDARENLAQVKLSDGNTLTLHKQARPQFGKNHDGRAYLTATMIYSGDGQSYAIRWIGDAVPKKMQEVAVKHDQGLAVAATTILLDLADAVVMPSWSVQHGNKRRTGPRPSERDGKAERARVAELRATGVPKRSRAKRTCARLTAQDV